MDSSKNYIYAEHADAAIILLLGSGGSNALTKAAVKWLVNQGVNVLSLGPMNGAVGYHSFPLEHVENAIQALKRCGNQKIGILGASITTIPALTAAALFPDIVLTMAVAPCDYVLQGFTQEKGTAVGSGPLKANPCSHGKTGFCLMCPTLISIRTIGTLCRRKQKDQVTCLPQKRYSMIVNPKHR